MKRNCIGKETLEIEEDYSVILSDYILEEEFEIENEYYTGYGIEIEKKDKSRIEKSQIKAITTDQTRIDRIVKSLMHNYVTPVHLHDIIDDML